MLKQLQNLLDSETDPAFAKRAAFIFENIEENKPEKVLDIGCGRGFYAKAITEYSFIKEVHGIDINQLYVAKAKAINKDKRAVLKTGSIYSTGYKNNYFDFIICSEVLEHLENEQGALKELYRILKKEGILIITVPNLNFPFMWDPLNWVLMRFFNTHVNKNIWWLAGMWADHVRLYNEGTLQELLKEANFTIIKKEKFIHYCWPFSHFILYGIGKNLVERVGFYEFDRFNMRKKSMSRIVSSFFSLPSRCDRGYEKSTVGIACMLKK